MAALTGFDVITVTEELSGPFVLGQILTSLGVVPRLVVAGFDITVTSLDSNGAPAVVLEIGDGVDTDRFLSGSTIAQAGGTVEGRPVSAAWYRYTTLDTVDVRVATAPATSLNGTVALSLYTYASTDYAALRRMVLQELRVLAAGDEVRAEDAEIVDAALSEVHENLAYKTMRARGDLAWPLALVPMFAARSYALMTAQRLGPVYQINPQMGMELAQRALGADHELRRMTRAAHDGEPVLATYY